MWIEIRISNEGCKFEKVNFMNWKFTSNSFCAFVKITQTKLFCLQNSIQIAGFH